MRLHLLLTRQSKSVGLTKLRLSMSKSLQKTAQPTRMQIVYKRNAVLLVVHVLPLLTQEARHCKFDKPSSTSTASPCKYCGGSAHRDRHQCPASERTCSKCGKKGHFASVCLSQRNSDVPPRRHQRSNVASVFASTQASRAHTVQANISTPNGTCTIVALPDTGADISAAGLNFLESLGEPLSNLLPPTDQPMSADGSPMKCLG